MQIVCFIYYMIGVYFESWTGDWKERAEDLTLAKIDKPIDIVFLSFVAPYAKFVKGSQSFDGTGLQFNASFPVIKEAIKILRRQKGIKVMLSVGGASYKFENGFNPKAIADLVWDLDLDGVDLDWESDHGIAKGYELGPIIEKMRAYIGTSKLLSIAGWSTGAYPPQSGNTYQGMNIAALQSHGHLLDFVNIMAYDAGQSYDPIAAYEAYRNYYKGKILVGFETGKQGWGDAYLKLHDVEKVTNYIKSKGNEDGIFVWAYRKDGDPSPAQVIQTAANILNNTITPYNSLYGKRSLDGVMKTDTTLNPVTALGQSTIDPNNPVVHVEQVGELPTHPPPVDYTTVTTNPAVPASQQTVDYPASITQNPVVDPLTGQVINEPIQPIVTEPGLLPVPPNPPGIDYNQTVTGNPPVPVTGYEPAQPVISEHYVPSSPTIPQPNPVGPVPTPQPTFTPAVPVPPGVMNPQPGIYVPPGAIPPEQPVFVQQPLGLPQRNPLMHPGTFSGPCPNCGYILLIQ